MILKNNKDPIILLNIFISFFLFKYFLIECPIRAHTTALEAVEITKHIKINKNS